MFQQKATSSLIRLFFLFVCLKNTSHKHDGNWCYHWEEFLVALFDILVFFFSSMDFTANIEQTWEIPHVETEQTASQMSERCPAV